MQADGFCRDCLAPTREAMRCASCRSPRVLQHAELHDLAIAHLDCDAFYAAVEKRDNPSLKDMPVIVGGARRGVVSTACYVARIRGVRSAMPMFKALALCPDAVVIKPNMDKYAAAARAVRALMQALTPLVEPLSIDEAFLDLRGTERLHGHSPAVSLATLARAIERKIGITVSIGLSHNKFLAKVASELDKPRGFSIIGRAETLEFLSARPVATIWGVGKTLQARLAKDGIHRIADLQKRGLAELERRYGTIGARLYHLARGEDYRSISTDDDHRSISAETTFNEDITDGKALERILWRLSERVSRRAKAHGQGGRTVALKLKTRDFKIRTRSVTLEEPTLLASEIFAVARPLLRKEATGTAYRLIGVGISHLAPMAEDALPQTLDAAAAARARAELAMDRLRQKFGRHAVERGLALGAEEDERY